MKKYLIGFLLAFCSVYFFDFPNLGTLSANRTAAPQHLSSSRSADSEQSSRSSLTDILVRLGIADREETEALTVPELPQAASAVLNKKDLYLHFKETTDRLLADTDYVPIEEIPVSLQQALIATEDKRYYEHGPIDFIGIGRAAFANFQSGDTVEGGSTITQQVAKNLFLSQERTFSRKAEELLLAILLERHYSKQEILAMYLNTAYFGANAYGIQEASRIYFDTVPQKLTLGQSAMLAGLPQAPSYLNPFVNYKGAKEKQRLVLELMTAQNYITLKAAKSAYAEEMHFTGTPEP